MAASLAAHIPGFTSHHQPLQQRGAYAVVLDDAGRVLVVRTHAGRCYLPGGRIEQGESARAALLREIAEECAWSARLGVEFLRAVQPIMAQSVSLTATYWRATLLAPLPTAAEHEVMWLDAAEARTRLHRHADALAVNAALPVPSAR